ncbi:MAG: OsmC family protein [Acidobacteria bacterium]|nr:OsmC family protein [Acidobacteriota bacterium]
MKVNNVSVDQVRAFAEAASADPAKAVRRQVVEARWVPEDGPVQFEGVVKFERGEARFQLDNPSFMGGSGQHPGPFQYCFFGLAACYTGIFATFASQAGIVLKSLAIRVEADINFSRVIGLGEQPPMEEVRVTLSVESDADPEKIREVEEAALQRCPVVYTLRNPIRLVPGLEINPAGRM